MTPIEEILKQCDKYEKLKAEVTQGEWNQGRLLLTNETKRWTQGQKDHADDREKRMVFCNFTSTDEGSGRRPLFASPDVTSKEDAAFIAYAHNWEPTKIIRELVEQLQAFKNTLNESQEIKRLRGE